MRDGLRREQQQRGELRRLGCSEQGAVDARAVAQVVGGVVACEEKNVAPEQGDGVLGWCIQPCVGGGMVAVDAVLQSRVLVARALHTVQVVQVDLCGEQHNLQPSLLGLVGEALCQDAQHVGRDVVAVARASKLAHEPDDARARGGRARDVEAARQAHDRAGVRGGVRLDEVAHDGQRLGDELRGRGVVGCGVVGARDQVEQQREAVARDGVGGRRGGGAAAEGADGGGGEARVRASHGVRELGEDERLAAGRRVREEQGEEVELLDRGGGGRVGGSAAAAAAGAREEVRKVRDEGGGQYEGAGGDGVQGEGVRAGAAAQQRDEGADGEVQVRGRREGEVEACGGDDDGGGAGLEEWHCGREEQGEVWVDGGGGGAGGGIRGVEVGRGGGGGGGGGR